LLCHFSRGDFQRSLCCATFHAVISSAFSVVPRFTRWFRAHFFWCHLLHQPSHSLHCACFTISAFFAHSCSTPFALSMFFYLPSYFIFRGQFQFDIELLHCNISLIVSLVCNDVAPDINNDQCFSWRDAVSVFLS
jgi:hypothetical protein